MNKRKLHGLPVQEEPAALKPQPPGPLAPIGKPEPVGSALRMTLAPHLKVAKEERLTEERSIWFATSWGAICNQVPSVLHVKVSDDISQVAGTYHKECG